MDELNYKFWGNQEISGKNRFLADISDSEEDVIKERLKK